MFRESIRKGIEILKNDDKDLFEMILLKDSFHLSQNVKLCFVYASPFNSLYTKGRTENVLDLIERKNLDSVDENCIILGDLIGRTKLGENFVRDKKDKHSPINNMIYNKDEQMHRENMDNAPID